MRSATFTLLILAGMLLAACYRSPNDSIFADDLDMVTTNYELDLLDGNDYITYAIADSFGLASNVDDFTIDDANDPKLRSAIKNALRDNLGDQDGNGGYGYTLVEALDTANPPDLYIPVTITYINTKGIAYYPIYSPGYGYGYPGYGYGYGYWGGYYSWGYIPTTFNYDQGSILIDLMDVKNRKDPLPGDSVYQVEVVWNMGISGLIENTSETDRNNRISAAIDKGFEQSPYLNKKQ